MQKRLCLALWLILTFSSCDEAPPANKNQNPSPSENLETEKKKPPVPKDLDEALNESISDDVKIAPLADGGAYVVTDYGVWYLKEGSSKKVKEIPDTIKK